MDYLGFGFLGGSWQTFNPLESLDLIHLSPVEMGEMLKVTFLPLDQPYIFLLSSIFNLQSSDVVL